MLRKDCSNMCAKAVLGVQHMVLVVGAAALGLAALQGCVWNGTRKPASNEAFVRRGAWLDDEPGWHDPNLKEAVHRLTWAEDPALRQNAFRCLAGMHRRNLIGDDEAEPLLARGLRDPLPETKLEILTHLAWESCFLAKKPDLLKDLKVHLAAAVVDQDPRVRALAVSLLGDVGPDARFARRELGWALSDSEFGVVQNAQHAIMLITGQKTLPKTTADILHTDRTD